MSLTWFTKKNVLWRAIMNEEMVMTWLNYYECPECEDIWQDEWDCQVDDDCPSCGCKHISPYESVDI